MDNKLYEFTMRVLRGDARDSRGEGGGAYVPCYASATDYQNAVRKGVAQLVGMDYRFDDLKGPVREINPAHWGEYVALVWPEFTANLPTQDDLGHIVAEGGVFFGPFAGFEGQA